MQQFKTWFDRNFTVNGNGKIKALRGGYISDVEALKKYKDTMEELGFPCEVSIEAVRGMVAGLVAEMAPSADDKKKPINVRQLVLDWTLSEECKFLFDATWLQVKSVSGLPRTLDDVAREIRLYCQDRDLKVNRESIKDAVYSIASNKQSDKFATIRSIVAYVPAAEKCREEFLRALYDYFQVNQSFEVFSTVMSHWAWQVKRKAWGLPVKWHIWPHFYGPAGLGKTTALRKISSPWDGFADETTISKLFDDTREIRRITQNFILIFDELAVNNEASTYYESISADKKSFLKSMLTGKSINARVMGSQEQMKADINFSAISSANTHIYDLLFDPDTMRRYFEFDCSNAVKKPYDAVNKYLDKSQLFWRSIDESLEDGYFIPETEVARIIDAEQHSYYPTNTTTARWINLKSVVPGHDSVKDVFDAYKDWCREAGFQARNLTNWIEDVKHLLPSAVNDDETISLRLPE